MQSTCPCQCNYKSKSKFGTSMDNLRLNALEVATVRALKTRVSSAFLFPVLTGQSSGGVLRHNTHENKQHLKGFAFSCLPLWCVRYWQVPTGKHAEPKKEKHHLSTKHHNKGAWRN